MLQNCEESDPEADRLGQSLAIVSGGGHARRHEDRTAWLVCRMVAALAIVTT
jgi:hypothetical protein